MSGAHQSVFMNQRSFGPPPGQQEYTTGGTYTFIVPAGVESISSVVVSSGGVGKTTQAGGPGGNLRYITSLAVTPEESLTVVVGPSSTTAGALIQDSTIARGVTILLSSVSSISGSIGGGDGGNGGAAYSTAGTFGTVKTAVAVGVLVVMEAMAVLAVLQVVMAQAAVLAVGLRQQDRRKTLLLFPVVPMALAVAVLAF